MATKKKHTLRHISLGLYLEADHLAASLEHALTNPAARCETFFQHIDRLAIVMGELHPDTARRERHAMAA